MGAEKCRACEYDIRLTLAIALLLTIGAGFTLLKKVQADCAAARAQARMVQALERIAGALDGGR